MSANLSETLAVTSYDFDPNVTTAVAVGWVDMFTFGSLLVAFTRTIGTSALTFIIQGSASSNGASPVTVKTITLAAQPDAVGDVVFGEANVNDMLSAGTDIRYLSATLTFATATDEAVVTYIRGNSNHCKASLTADIVA